MMDLSTRTACSHLRKKERELLQLCANPIATKSRVVRIEQLVEDPDVDINCVDQDGNNALLRLCRMNRCDDLWVCIEALLRNHKSGDVHRRIDINHQNKQGWNALLLLCRFHQDENLLNLFHLLTEHGISLRAKTEHNWTALLLLSRHYNNENLLEIAKLYLKHAHEDINYRTDFGSNSLSLLCRYYSCRNLPDIVKLYIDHGIDVNCINNDKRNALVILCRFRGSDTVVECLRMLIENGADIDCTDCEGWNALQFLCSHYSRDNLIGLVCLLTQRSPVVMRYRTNSGITALEALSRNWSGMFHSLLNKLSVDVELDDQSIARIIINTSLLGCFNSTWALMLRLEAVPVDTNGREPFFYLERVTNYCFTLCNEPMCRSITRDHIESLQNEFKSARRIFIQPTWEKQVFMNEITYNDQWTYRHDGRDRHISVPSVQNWFQLCSSWNNNTVTMEEIDDYLGKHSHPQESNHSNCSWCQVAKDVDNCLIRILNKIKEIDPLFETEQFHMYGSSTEKTDIFLPSESDRLIVLKHFRQSPYNPKEVVYAGTCPETDSPLKKNEPINSSSLLLRMSELVKAAVDCCSCVRIFGPIVGYSETCVTIHFLYRGRCPPAIKASVDITIAVKMKEFTNDIVLPACCGMSRNLPSFLVPFRRVEGSRWQTSFPTVERDLILNGGDCVAKVYKLLKFLVALHRAKEDRKKEIPRKSCPSSYALKTCIIRYMISYPPPWHSDDVIQHAIGVLNNYPMNSSELKWFFDQNHVIYEVSQKSKNFVSEIIDKLEYLQGETGESTWL